MFFFRKNFFKNFFFDNKFHHHFSSDFGFSKQALITKTPLGTGVYMAPEILSGELYTNKVELLFRI